MKSDTAPIQLCYGERQASAKPMPKVAKFSQNLFSLIRICQVGENKKNGNISSMFPVEVEQGGVEEFFKLKL